jgi:hypothetical protein
MIRSSSRLSFEGSNAVLSLFSGEPSPEPTTAQTGPRETAFRRVEGGAETTSGTVLLVEAYVALWVILFAFLFISWRRQARIDARIAELERSFAQHHGAK